MSTRSLDPDPSRAADTCETAVILMAHTLVRPIRDERIRWSLKVVPWLMLLFVPWIVWPTNPLGIPGQYFFATGFVSALLALFAFQTLMDRIASVFCALWRRGLIGPQHGDVLPAQPDQGRPAVALQQYVAYTRAVEDTLNRRVQWILVVACIVLILIWYLTRFSAEFFTSPILVVGILAEFMIGAVIGLMVWRMITIAIVVWRLPKQFDLVIQIGHPDRCGGLSVLGSLCLWNALIIAIAGIFLGGWLAIGPSTPYRAVFSVYQRIYEGLLVIPIIASFMCFFMPLWSTHQVMVANKSRIDARLDGLTHYIDQETRDLLNSAESLDPIEGETRRRKLELVRQVYDQNRHVPTWPINLQILSTFAASQVGPILSLIGLADPLLNAGKVVIQVIQPDSK